MIEKLSYRPLQRLHKQIDSISLHIKTMFQTFIQPDMNIVKNLYKKGINLKENDLTIYENVRSMQKILY